MGDDVLIRCENVGKKFCSDLKRSLWYGLTDTLSEVIAGHRWTSKADGQISGEGEEDALRPGEFWANRRASFVLRRGQCLGLIGKNGAGKTTLLKLLTGLLRPDTGRISIRGSMSAMIALGAGFNPILSGRENIQVNASLLGFSRKETREMTGEIIDFAGLRDFIDMPVRNYSSGMQIRLGFSVAVAAKPDILVIDEVLAVGDMEFRSKCYDRIEKMRGNTGILLVSHNRQDIVRVCTECIYLSGGVIKAQGKASTVLTAYEAESHGNSSFVREHCGVRLSKAELSATTLTYGESVDVAIEVDSDEDLTGILFRISIMDYTETAAAEWRSENHQRSFDLRKGRNRFSVTIGNLRLRSGEYFCNFIFHKPNHSQYLILAFNHCKLTLKGGVEGLCTFQL